MTRRAFSLAETVVTCFLLALVIGLAVELWGKAAEVVRFSNAKDLELTATTVAMERLASELREAVHFGTVPPVVTPPGSPTGSDLTFVKLNPDPTRSPARLPTLSPSPPYFPGAIPASWDPQDPSYLVGVHYYVDPNGLLTREISGQTMAVAERIVGFGCSVDGTPGAGWDQTVYLALSLSQNGRIITYTSQVFCPALEP